MLRALNDAEIDAFLKSHALGSLGCALREKQYVFPIAYVYHDNVLYGQTTVGRKIEAARESKTVCLTVYEVTGTGWLSVMCWGTFEELDFAGLAPGTATTVVKLLTERIGSIQHNLGVNIPYIYDGVLTPGTVNDKQATLFRIVVTEKSGRCWENEKQ